LDLVRRVGGEESQQGECGNHSVLLCQKS
jgi:hypothetical protein